MPITSLAPCRATAIRRDLTLQEEIYDVSRCIYEASVTGGLMSARGKMLTGCRRFGDDLAKRASIGLISSREGDATASAADASHAISRVVGLMTAAGITDAEMLQAAMHDAVRS